MEALEIIRKTMKEFSGVPDEDVEAFILLSQPLISQKRFGKLYQQALAYTTAHRMKMDGLGNKIGSGTIGDTIGISSVSEGETSVSFSNNQTNNLDSDAEYGLTVYGMRFLQLRRSCIITIASAGVNHGS
ncbi:MAG: DUF4054 domain-containing protein [Lachnospiraceae bacterium]